MDTIYVFRILNIFSLVFMIINFLCNPYEYRGTNIFLYIWICSITAVISLIKGKKQKHGIEFLCFLGLAPILCAHTMPDKIYIIIITCVSFYIVFKDLFIIDYPAAKFQYAKCIYLIVGATVLGFFLMALDTFIKDSIIYIIIFFITSSMVLRLLRSFNYTGETQSKGSFSILGVFMALSLTLGNDSVKKSIFKFLAKIYGTIVDIIFGFFAFILKPIAGFLEKLFIALQNMINRKVNMYRDKSTLDISDKITKYKIDSTQKSLVEIIFSNKIFITCVYAIIILIALYIIYKIFISGVIKSTKYKQYVEKREFILNENNNGILKKIADKFKIRNNNEKIRYYYIKLLKLYVNKGIIIQDSDTTKDINIKAKGHFDCMCLNSIRDIYINVRYGNIKADNNMLNEFEKHYKDIKKTPDIQNIR